MKQKKWVSLEAVGFGSYAHEAEKNAAEIIAGAVNELKLQGEDWKVISSRPFISGARSGKAEFIIYFMVNTDMEIGSSLVLNIPDKLPA